MAGFRINDATLIFDKIRDGYPFWKIYYTNTESDAKAKIADRNDDASPEYSVQKLQRFLDALSPNSLVYIKLSKELKEFGAGGDTRTADLFFNYHKPSTINPSHSTANFEIGASTGAPSIYQLMELNRQLQLELMEMRLEQKFAEKTREHEKEPSFIEKVAIGFAAQKGFINPAMFGMTSAQPVAVGKNIQQMPRVFTQTDVKIKPKPTKQEAKKETIKPESDIMFSPERDEMLENGIIELSQLEPNLPELVIGLCKAIKEGNPMWPIVRESLLKSGNG